MFITSLAVFIIIIIIALKGSIRDFLQSNHCAAKRQTDRQTDRQRQRQRETERQTERGSGREGREGERRGPGWRGRKRE